MTPQEKIAVKLFEEYGISIDDTVKAIKRYMPNFGENKFRDAFLFAALSHQGQYRRDNTPYISHPVETVRILSSIHADEDTLIAAVLHDVPEDTKGTIRDIERRFGKNVAYLVDGITKLAKVHYQHDMAKRQVDSLKKLFIHTASDPRIILIKLADRIHNMRTLQYISKPQKRIRIARETLEIFVPIANLIGIEEFKSELEDLCFKYLFPEDYESLSERLNRSRLKNAPIVDKTIKTLEEEFRKRKLIASVHPRQRNIYAIYKRIIRDERGIDEYDDLISLRILVQSEDDCYKALGILHSIFKPKPGKFKDYIAVPKNNGYQSLHTSVFGMDGMTSEFQIRTNQMHLEAEHGIAAHFYYGESAAKSKSLERDKRNYWAEKIKSMQHRKLVDEEFMEDLKLDIFSNRMFVFTPKGDVVDLPQNATAIDFAYAIHSEIGDKAEMAEINGKLTMLASELNNGDTVRIVQSKNKNKAPDRRWLNFVKTNAARNRIKDYFKKIPKAKKIEIGRDLLQKEFDRCGLGLISEIPPLKLKKFINNHKNINSFDDILMKVGEGTLSTLEFIDEVYKLGNSPTIGFMNMFEVHYKESPESKDLVTNVLIKITSIDAVGQLHKILRIVNKFNINAVKTLAYLSFWKKDFICKIKLQAHNFTEISNIMASLEQIDGVKMVGRVFWQRKLLFSLGLIFAVTVWALHPYAIFNINKLIPYTEYPLLHDLFGWIGVCLLYATAFIGREILKRSFPELRKTKLLLSIIHILVIFVLLTLILEYYFLRLNISWLAAVFAATCLTGFGMYVIRKRMQTT
jgi:guanosine-3',5'-bis(diphosphate) 3'-pyrophosphohydrolase